MKFNSTFEQLQESATIAINQQTKALNNQGFDITGFGFGESPFPAPQQLQQALANNTHHKEYLPSLGLFDLREAVADYFSARQGVEWDADTIAIAPGSKMLLYQLQQLLDAPLILPTPAWVSYAPQAMLLNKPVHILPTTFEDGWVVKADVLDAHLQRLNYPHQKLMILNAPNNPSGQSQGDLQALAEVCLEHKVLVISDEIYAPLTFEGSSSSLSTLIPEQVIVTGGLSKAWAAGGYRLGFAAAKPTKAMRELFAKLAILISETYTSVAAPIQYASLSVWRDDADAVDDYVEQCKTILHQALTLAHQHLTSSGLNCHPATGGFYLFPDYSPFSKPIEQRDIKTSFELCQALLQQAKVASLPASDFGLAGQFATRLAIVNFNGAEALDILAQGKPLTEVFEPIVTGCQRVHDWLHAKS